MMRWLISALFAALIAGIFSLGGGIDAPHFKIARAHAQIGPLVGYGPLPFLLCGHTKVTITAPGGGSFTANGCPITFEIWAAGGSGGGSTSTHSGGGGGGGAGTIILTPGAGVTVYYSVGTGGTGTTGEGNPGTNSWINIATNAQPTSSTNGCYATGGTSDGNNSGGGGGMLCTNNYTGGNGAPYSGSVGGGGGGGAGSAGNGLNGTNPTGGAGGSGGGGGGGNGDHSTPTAGTAPGGGGGGAYTLTGGSGANGQIVYSY